MQPEYYQRTELLVGSLAMQELRRARVAVFGVGGVGSWAVESLVRSGIEHLTLVDFDTVAASNINRQLPATTLTVGQPKAEVLRQRMLEINPEACIEIRNEAYTPLHGSTFDLSAYDYIIDAIDSIDCKAHLIIESCRSKAVLFSSMGAALKIDPSRIGIAEFWKVKGCPLAASLRRRFKKSGVFPRRKFKCVYSDELLKNHDLTLTEDHTTTSASPTAGKRPNGTVAHITAIFGFTLASLVVRHIVDKTNSE